MSRKRKVLSIIDNTNTNLNNDTNLDKKLKKLKKEEVKINLLSPQDLSNLFNLPVELKVKIFNYLDFKTLSTVSTVCKLFRDIVVNHFLLNKTRINIMLNQINYKTIDDNYLLLATDLGLLLKRSTFIYPSKYRVEIIIKIFKLMNLKIKLRTIYEDDKNDFRNFSRIIRNIFSKIISGWKYKESLQLIEEFELYFDNGTLIKSLLTNDYGIIKFDEQYLRYFYRKILFESFDDNLSRAKWLNDFLNYHTVIVSDEYRKLSFQSKLIILLFSPIFQEENSDIVYIDWYSFSNTIFIKEGLDYLGFALQLLDILEDNKKPNIVKLFKTITNVGLKWLPENEASLLFHSGIHISKKIIDYKLKKEDYYNLVKCLANLFIVESKLSDLNKLESKDRIVKLIIEYLKSQVNNCKFDTLLDLITADLFNYSKLLDTLPDEREYLEVSELVRGMMNFYEITRPKKLNYPNSI